MALVVSNKTSQKEQKVDAAFKGIKEALAQHLESVDKSHKFFKAGLDDDFANYLSAFVENHLAVVSDTFDTHMEAIGKILETGIIQFFVDNKTVIDRVYKTNEAG